MAKLIQMKDRLTKDGRERAEILEGIIVGAQKEEDAAKKVFDAAANVYNKKIIVRVQAVDELEAIEALLSTIGRTL